MIRKLLILIKRILCKPVYIGLLLLIPAVAIFIRLLPEDSMSTNIYMGYINYDTDDRALKLNEMLSGSSYGFVFVEYDSQDRLYRDVASGQLDCAYIIPENFSEEFTKNVDNCNIQLICSPATTYSAISMEVVYNDIISVYSPSIVKEYYKNNEDVSSIYKTTHSDFIDSYYDDLLEGDSLFTITTNSNDAYNGRAVVSNTFPFHKFTGLIIFIAAMLGLMNYLKDDYEHIYDRIPEKMRIGLCLLNVFASCLPAGLTAYIALVIYGGYKSALGLLVHIIIYILICMIFCILYRFVFRNYHVFSGAMPVIIICTMIFSPIFIDLSDIIKETGFLSYLFPVTYF